MADYKKMYATLCGAIDDVLAPLQKIPLAHAEAARLQQALLLAEEIYLHTEFCAEKDGKIIHLKKDG